MRKNKNIASSKKLLVTITCESKLIPPATHCCSCNRQDSLWLHSESPLDQGITTEMSHRIQRSSEPETYEETEFLYLLLLFFSPSYFAFYSIINPQSSTNTLAKIRVNTIEQAIKNKPIFPRQGH